MKDNDVLALGNALMDFLVEVDDQHLQDLNLNKGQFHSIEEHQAQELLQKISHLQIETVPGGSCANTLRGFASLGGKCLFCGKVGHDSHGENYIQALQAVGVSTQINKHPVTTGHAITFITPDSERTFSVHLGASLKLSQADVSEEDIKNSKILHVEGYHLGASTKDVALHAISLAKQNDTLVSLDLSDAGVVTKAKEIFQAVLPQVDILFANEEEAKALTDLEPAQAVQLLAEQVKIAIVKIGKAGSLICQDGLITMVPGFPANALDSTGAGDTYSAGFLYGYTQSWPIEKCGKLGSLMAAKIVEHKGVKTDQLNIEEIKREIN